MLEVPRPVNRDQTYLVAICELLETQNALLAEIRDRLPAPAVVGQPEPDEESVAVHLREPADAPPPSAVKTTKPRARKAAPKTEGAP